MYKGKSVWFTLLIGMILITVSGVFFKGTEYSRPQDGPAGSGPPSISGPPAETRSAALHIAVAMQEAEFEALQKKHAAYAESRPHHTYTLERLEPSAASMEIRERTRTGDIPDIVLLPNTAIIEFAATGYLAKVKEQSPGDGDSSHVSRAVDAQVEWNGIAWGMPVDIDPYLFVYRADEGEWPEGAAYADVAEWLEARRASHDSPAGGEWLLLRRDPMLLTALGTQLFQLSRPADSLQEEAEAWEWKLGGGQSLPVRLTAAPYASVLSQVADGQAMVAAAPLSALHQFDGSASLRAAVLPQSEDGWSGAWQPGRSFAVSSKSEYEREAFEWVNAVNDASLQLAIMEQGGGAPVSNSASPLYSGASPVPASVISAALQRLEAYRSAPSFYHQQTAVIRELELLHDSDRPDASSLAEAIETMQRSFTQDERND
ncbi:hypothetical protein DUZ99_05210 [Xylanibacillus composti]|uniref:Extracellular solute-binding protein n=1 Tax=Xylanibacillus composti TaxID=1572762 RepID=A0A8J4H1Q7_9BACL|nr:extracellular solute-binding protein [Xylanibacillus composti]MDT9724386.1 hypothetical protein [Xylanibacillus composti]GIQ67981.1 extracellular solute-binding protein [Xylanibacillus composti]